MRTGCCPPHASSFLALAPAGAILSLPVWSGLEVVMNMRAMQKKQQALCDAWTHPEGTAVTVRKDGGALVETHAVNLGEDGMPDGWRRCAT